MDPSREVASLVVLVSLLLPPSQATAGRNRGACDRARGQIRRRADAVRAERRLQPKPKRLRWVRRQLWKAFAGAIRIYGAGLKRAAREREREGERAEDRGGLGGNSWEAFVGAIRIN